MEKFLHIRKQILRILCHSLNIKLRLCQPVKAKITFSDAVKQPHREIRLTQRLQILCFGIAFSVGADASASLRHLLQIPVQQCRTVSSLHFHQN